MFCRVSGHLEYIGLKDVNFTIRKKNEGYGAGVRLYVVLELPSSLIRKHYLAALVLENTQKSLV